VGLDEDSDNRGYHNANANVGLAQDIHAHADDDRDDSSNGNLGLEAYPHAIAYDRNVANPDVDSPPPDAYPYRNRYANADANPFGIADWYADRDRDRRHGDLDAECNHDVDWHAFDVYANHDGDAIRHADAYRDELRDQHANLDRFAVRDTKHVDDRDLDEYRVADYLVDQHAESDGN
jgi:hypothetical protein